MDKVLIADDDRRTLKFFKKALKIYEDKFEILTAQMEKRLLKC